MKYVRIISTRKGSYLDKQVIPIVGDIVWALIGFVEKVVKGKIVSISDIDRKGLANTYIDIISKGKKYHVNTMSIFDHKPKRVKKKDRYGEVIIWQ
jgi:hypothetical protein